MMTPDAHDPGPARVSIFERLVPSLAFAVTAISGAVGAVMIFRFFSTLRHAESAGVEAFLGGMAEIEVVVAIVLIFAAVLCAIGILISAIRLFTTNSTSSPPGLLFLLVGLLSLIPPFAIHYILHMMKGIAVSNAPADGGVSAVADLIMNVSYIAIALAGVTVVVLLAFSFVPFRSRLGKKASPLICLFLVEILIAVLVGVYFWEARTSIAERDRYGLREDEIRAQTTPSFDSPDATNDSVARGNVVTDETYQTDANTTPGNRPKIISGGVLNGKATSLPKPPYPPAARAVRAAGSVSVQVTVDEQGEVISASAVSGHPLLRAAAVQAARQARFSPTKLSGVPVKVTGIVTYNFSDR